MSFKYILRGAGVVAALGSVLAFVWPSGQDAATLQLPGVVEVQEVRLASKIGGRVKEVTAKESAIVAPGQVLVRFEAPEAEAKLAQARAQLKGAEALLEKARTGPRTEEKAAAREAARAAEARWKRLKAGSRVEEIGQARAEAEAIEADLERARQDLERQRDIASRGGSAPAEYDAVSATFKRLERQARAARFHLRLLEAGSRPEEITEAEAEWEKTRANLALLEAGTRREEIDEAESRVADLRAHVRELEANLDEAVVRAPERVVIEVVSVRPGDTVSPNQPVIRALRADDLWVKAYVPETELGKLRLRQAAEVTTDSYPGRRFSGEVSYIASTSEFTPRNVQSADERRHQVFAIKVRVTDPQGIFKSGMAADVSVPLMP
jgi:multidrug resistance efflux pump